MKFRPEINNILNDRESGSITLLNRLVNAIDSMLIDTASGRGEFTRMIREVRRKLRHFAAIENFCADLLVKLELPGTFPASAIRYISEYRNYWDESSHKIMENFLGYSDPGGKNILIHSNSHTIISLLENLKKSGYSFYVYQTLSIPGKEGKTSFRKLQWLDIKAELINDEEVGRIMPGVDLVLMGCDTLLKDQFLNKTGTVKIAEKAQELGVPFVLVTESRKIIRSEDWKMRLHENPLFEWIPLHMVTETITEKQLDNLSIFAARIKSFSESPLMAWVQSSISTSP